MRRLFHTFVLLWSFVAAAAHAANVEISAGGLPKSTDVGEFTLSITIRNVTLTQIQKGTDRNDITLTFEIRFPSIDSNPIAFTQAAAALSPIKFYAEQLGDVAESASANNSASNNTDLTYQIRIREAVAGELTAKVEQMKSMKINFKLGGEAIASDIALTLTKENYAINAAVAFTDIIGSHKSLVANWNVAADVATKGGDGKNRAPGAVSVFAISSTVEDGTIIPAKTFSTDEKSVDIAAQCVFRRFAREAIKNETGCLECPADTYVNESEMTNIPGVYYTSAPASSGTATIGSLINYSDANPIYYYVFMEYRPSGLLRSQCAVGVASANYTMTELNGEKDAKIVDFRCFIATAAYGTPLHEDLAIFRRFRDQTLRSNKLGQQLVHLYYRFSPAIAAVISRHESIRNLVRGGLSLLADGLRRRGYGDDRYLSLINP